MYSSFILDFFYIVNHLVLIHLCLSPDVIVLLHILCFCLTISVHHAYFILFCLFSLIALSVHPFNKSFHLCSFLFIWSSSSSPFSPSLCLPFPSFIPILLLLLYLLPLSFLSNLFFSPFHFVCVLFLLISLSSLLLIHTSPYLSSPDIIRWLFRPCSFFCHVHLSSLYPCHFCPISHQLSFTMGTLFLPLFLNVCPSWYHLLTVLSLFVLLSVSSLFPSTWSSMSNFFSHTFCFPHNYLCFVLPSWYHLLTVPSLFVLLSISSLLPCHSCPISSHHTFSASLIIVCVCPSLISSVDCSVLVRSIFIISPSTFFSSTFLPSNFFSSPILRFLHVRISMFVLPSWYHLLAVPSLFVLLSVSSLLPVTLPSSRCTRWTSRSGRRPNRPTYLPTSRRPSRARRRPRPATTAPTSSPPSTCFHLRARRTPKRLPSCSKNN